MRCDINMRIACMLYNFHAVAAATDMLRREVTIFVTTHCKVTIFVTTLHVRWSRLPGRKPRLALPEPGHETPNPAPVAYPQPLTIVDPGAFVCVSASDNTYYVIRLLNPEPLNLVQVYVIVGGWCDDTRARSGVIPAQLRHRASP